MLKKLLGGLGDVAGIVGTPALLMKLLPWAVLVVVAVVSGQWVRIAGLKSDIVKCEARYDAHIEEDRRRAEEAKGLKARQELEDAERIRLIEEKSKETRDELEARVVALDAELRAGARSVRPEICRATATTGRDVPGAVPAAGASSSPPAEPDGASRLARAVRAAAQCDSDYADLLAIAASDRKTCGVRP